MSSLFQGPVDLLRQRRLEVGLPGDPSRTKPAWQLMLVGGLLGGALLLPALGLQLVLGYLESQTAIQLDQLNGLPARVKALEEQLKGAQAGAKRLETSNQGLANGLVNVSSGSALIANLIQLVPSGVELKEASVVGPVLSLKGGANDPDAFRRINALQLQLAYSPMFQPDSVKVLKLSRDGTRVGLAPGQVSFELSSGFKTPDPGAQLKHLQSLGASGMAERLQILRAGGVLP
jgi:type IV pilus assembly protein PilN